MSNYKIQYWRNIQKQFFKGFSSKEKTSGYEWTKGYKQYTKGMGNMEDNANGYVGHGQGTLIIDATGSTTKLSYDNTTSQNVKLMHVTMGESMKFAANAANRRFLNTKTAEDAKFQQAVSLYITGMTLPVALKAFFATPTFLGAIGIINSVDDLTLNAYSNLPKSPNAANVIKTGIAGGNVGFDVKGVIKTPGPANVPAAFGIASGVLTTAQGVLKPIIIV